MQKTGTRLVVLQAPGGQTTVFDYDKPHRAGVGFNRIGAFVAHDLKAEIPEHGLPVEDFPKWQKEREDEGTVFHPVSTIF